MSDSVGKSSHYRNELRQRPLRQRESSETPPQILSSPSTDRVFVHALNTVKKMPRTGSARPPQADRLKLYGLYKQSMEGDVDGVMDRPSGDGAEVEAERGKW